MKEDQRPSTSTVVANILVRGGLLCIVMMVGVGALIFLGFASDSPNAPSGQFDRAFLSLKLFALAGCALAVTPTSALSSKNPWVKAVLMLLLLLFLQPVVVIPMLLGF